MSRALLTADAAKEAPRTDVRYESDSNRGLLALAREGIGVACRASQRFPRGMRARMGTRVKVVHHAVRRRLAGLLRLWEARGTSRRPGRTYYRALEAATAESADRERKPCGELELSWMTSGD